VIFTNALSSSFIGLTGVKNFMLDIDEIRIHPLDNFESVNDMLYEKGFTDGLPVVPPTEDRLHNMLNGRDPDRVIAKLAPTLREASLKRLAFCAVMAGCRPEYFPVLIAAIEAVSQPEFNLIGIQTTTGTATPLIIVNGPIIHRIGLNYGCNALGPGVRSNAAIGRSLALALRNIGGAMPGRIDLSTMGQPGKYTFCFAENEAANPWEPLHVSRGFLKEQSTITVVGASGTMEIKDDRSRTAEAILTTFAKSITPLGSLGGRGLLGGGEPLLLLSPEHSRIIGRDMTRIQAQLFLNDTAKLPIKELSPELREFLDQLSAGTKIVWDAIRVAEKPEHIMLVVTGGVGIKSTFVQTWGGTTQAVTRPISEN
jgi:hypothetical protein